MSLAPLSGCLYWVPIPYAQNPAPEWANSSPSFDTPVILATHSSVFFLAMTDDETLTFSWTLSRDGHQSPSNQGTEGETQWQQVTLQPASDFGQQTLTCVVSDGTSQVTYEWSVEGS